mmetsp:Transcript_9457/g.13176  ORF Transcript_9457/g.13176 Transcript_9457/m.13176 type:complete len:87 (+) Transcript_9457:369-629(+)
MASLLLIMKSKLSKIKLFEAIKYFMVVYGKMNNLHWSLAIQSLIRMRDGGKCCYFVMRLINENCTCIFLQRKKSTAESYFGHEIIE